MLLASASLDVIVLAHGIPQLTVIQANQPLMNSALPTLLGQNNVTVNGIQLPGPTTRRQERKVTISPNRSSVSVLSITSPLSTILTILSFCFVRFVFGGKEKETKYLLGLP